MPKAKGGYQSVEGRNFVWGGDINNTACKCSQ